MLSFFSLRKFYRIGNCAKIRAASTEAFNEAKLFGSEAGIARFTGEIRREMLPGRVFYQAGELFGLLTRFD